MHIKRVDCLYNSIHRYSNAKNLEKGKTATSHLALQKLIGMVTTVLIAHNVSTACSWCSMSNYVFLISQTIGTSSIHIDRMMTSMLCPPRARYDRKVTLPLFGFLPEQSLRFNATTRWHFKLRKALILKDLSELRKISNAVWERDVVSKGE